MKTQIEQPMQFFDQLGGLHDAQIESINWDSNQRSISLRVDDLNANFEGLPEYGGRMHASIEFADVSNVQLVCDAFAGDVQRIYRINLHQRDSGKGYAIKMSISPSGEACFDFESLTVAKLA